MIYHWGTERRLNAYSDYFRRQFGQRVQKITLDAGFTCPNRDGTLGSGGCTFCNNKAFNPSYNHPEKSIRDQILQGMAFHKKRYRRASSYLAYFQAYSNTYSELDRLHSLYEQALQVPGIIGIVVGTRPDCIDAEKLDYFQELAKKYYVVIEYGIESVFDPTLRRVNRGHDAAASQKAVELTAARGLRVGGHLIVGLPGEQRQDILETARRISTWPLHSIKFHQLQLIKGTVMAKEYQEDPGAFMEFNMDSYLELMMEVLELLNPDIVVERIAGEVSPGMALRQGWGVRYDAVLRAFEELLEKNNSWQGKHYKEKR